MNITNRPGILQESMKRKLDSEKLRTIDEELDQAVSYFERDRQRADTNIGGYWGIDDSQWPDDVVTKHVREKRQLASYNVCRGKVDGLAGSLLTNRYEPNFVPIEGDINQDVNYIKDAFQADRELLNYKLARRECIIDGLIYEGTEEMYIDNRFHPLGNIGFRRLISGHVIYDPHWRTNSMWDCKKAWKVAYMTPAQMMETYKKSHDDIKAAHIMSKKTGDEYGNNSGVIFEPNLNPEHGNQYKVVEFYEVKDVCCDVEVDLLTGQDLPDSDDVELKVKWLKEQAPERDMSRLTDDVTIDPRQKKVLMVFAYSDLHRGVVLANDPHEIQIGRLHLFPFSAAKLNGQRSGIMDLILDPQKAINYRESLVTYNIQTSAQGGQVLDPALFNNDIRKINEYKAKKADPSYVGESYPGASNKFPNAIKSIESRAPNQAVFNQLERMYDIMDRISKQPAASDARTQSSSESGVLFAQKAKMAEIGQYCLSETVRQHENDKAEAYFIQYPITYGNHDVERDFTILSKKQRIKINQHEQLADGTERIKNRAKDIPRHKIVVSESPQGETRRLTTRALSTDLMATLPPENVGTRQKLTTKIVESLDFFDDEDQAELEQIGKLEMDQAIQQLETNIATLKMNKAQAEFQTQQMQSQMGGGGMPQQGAPMGLPAPEGGGGAPAAEGEPAAIPQIEGPQTPQVTG